MINYNFHPNLIVRNPRNPLDTNLSEAFFKVKIQQEDFLEAIYIASPSLYDACIRWREGKSDAKEIQKTLLSLTKYGIRMNSRCTPFGLFAGVSTTQWGEKTALEINKDSTRHTRLDMHFLCALAQKLAILPSVRYKIKYFSNSSIYYIGNDIRYVEYGYKGTTRVHQISSISHTEYIEAVIQKATNGASFYELVNTLVNDEITEPEAIDFLDELIDAQLLVNELEPAITGEEFTYQILNVLEKINDDEEITNYIAAIKAIQIKLKHIDSHTTNPVSAYKEIIDIIQTLGIDFEENRLFQADMTTNLAPDATLDNKIQADIVHTISKLATLQNTIRNTNLTSFAKRFYERYEDKEVPVLIALDAELGVGYTDKNTGDYTPLIEGIVLKKESKKQDKTIKWNESQNTLFNKLKDASEQNQYEIELSEIQNELIWNELPPSISVMFRLLNDDEILLESVGGSSAVNLLGRFAHADTRINQMVKEITAAEQYFNEDVFFAEIIHLPESRTGNILLHPTFRAYEIPYLAKSSLDKEHQIDLQDLMVSVRGNQLFLRSKRLNKIVIPRLSNAHNYTYNALPVYQFLCDLQNQGKVSGVGFDWGEMANQYQFLPRVRIKNVIVHAATWNLQKADFEQVIYAKADDLVNIFERFKTKHRLPRCFVLADGDNELLVDSTNELLIKTWIDAIKNKSSITLREFFVNTDNGIKDCEGRLFTNQFIAALIKEKESFSIKNFNKKETDIQRSFSVGSEWLYFKLYCGTKTADRVLYGAISQIVEEAKQRDLIDKWFFIRYNDPQFHIRLRFHLKDTFKINELIALFREIITPMEEEGFIWKIQTDTYQRELERYGSNTIELSEQLFYHDSESIVAFLRLTEGDDREHIRWVFGLKAIDALLNTFEYDIEQKLRLLQQLKDNFAAEFEIDQDAKSQLDKRYRENRASIESFEADYAELMNILELKNEFLRIITAEILELNQSKQLEVPLDDLLSSYIHMLVNRLITSNPRMHEMIMYDFLFRQYQSALARAKKTVLV